MTLNTHRIPVTKGNKIMGIKEIPRTFLYTCDACGEEHRQESAITNSHWVRIKIEQTAYDFQGAACADGSVERLLCETCSIKVIQTINKLMGE